MTLESDAKFKEKLTCGLENSMRNFENLGRLFRRSFWGGRRGVNSPSLELCQKLQIWHVSTYPYLVSENISFSAYASLVSIFLQKNSVFCPKKYLYSKQQCESCVIDFIVLFPVFLIQKVTVNGKVTFSDFLSGIKPPDGFKLATNPKNDNDVTIF